MREAAKLKINIQINITVSFIKEDSIEIRNERVNIILINKDSRYHRQIEYSHSSGSSCTSGGI